VWDVVLALLAGLGLALVFALTVGRLLCPVPGDSVWILVPGMGDGENLERELRGLMWLRERGLLRCPVAVADRGLSREGRELALRLVRRWPDVVLWPAKHLDELLEWKHT